MTTRHEDRTTELQWTFSLLLWSILSSGEYQLFWWVKSEGNYELGFIVDKKKCLIRVALFISMKK